VLAALQSLTSPQPSDTHIQDDWQMNVCFSIRTIQPQFLRDPEMSMLCSLVDIVPAGSTADYVAVWSKEAVDAFVSMIGNRAMLLTV